MQYFCQSAKRGLTNVLLVQNHLSATFASDRHSR